RPLEALEEVVHRGGADALQPLVEHRVGERLRLIERLANPGDEARAALLLEDDSVGGQIAAGCRGDLRVDRSRVRPLRADARDRLAGRGEAGHDRSAPERVDPQRRAGAEAGEVEPRLRMVGAPDRMPRPLERAELRSGEAEA